MAIHRTKSKADIRQQLARIRETARTKRDNLREMKATDIAHRYIDNIEKSIQWNKDQTKIKDIYSNPISRNPMANNFEKYKREQARDNRQYSRSTYMGLSNG